METPRILILGIGNTLLGDDGIGIRLAKALAPSYRFPIEVKWTEEMGFSLLDMLSGYSMAIILDSLLTANSNPGAVHVFRLQDFKALRGRSNHYTGLPEVAAVAKMLDIPFPARVHIIGIEVSDPFRIAASLSPELAQLLPGLVVSVRKELDEMIEKECALISQSEVSIA
jgi:hydrogenase maturation protease